MSDLQEGKDYVFRFDEETFNTHIELVSGSYYGVIFILTDVELKVNEDESGADLNYQYQIIDNVEYENLSEDENFLAHLSKVVESIINTNIVENTKDENRAINSKAPDL